MVFRRRGKLKKSYQWFYRGQQIEVVKNYKYLGILLSSGGSLGCHFEKQLASAKLGLNSTYRSIFYAKTFSLDPFFKFFDAVSRSTICYGAQVWGHIGFNEVEVLQRFFIKKLMWLPYNTPNYAVLLETGRDPMFLFTLKLHWTYLQHVLEMSDSRYPRKVFNFGRINNLKWFRNLRALAEKYNMWQNFLPFNASNFKRNICALYKLIQDATRVDLLNQVMLAQHHIWYKEVKLSCCREEYLLLGLNLKDVRYIIKARTDMLPLNCKLWFPESVYTCSLCNLNADENLLHFIAICPILKEFRERYFRLSRLSEVQFIQVLHGHFGWKQLALYVRAALEYRDELITDFNYR